jgi:hypothetical protein
MGIGSVFTLLLVALPSYSGVLNIPLRFFSLPTTILLKVAYRDSFLFLISASIFAIYILFAYIFSRKLNLIDISFILSLFFTWYLINFFYKKEQLLRRCISVFFFVNVTYALFQNFGLNVGIPNELLMLHQNTHQAGYIIPATYIPYFYRVTGLFNESVPYVLYLMISYLYFFVNKNVKCKYLSLLMILTSGAKLGIVFVLLNLVIGMFRGVRIYRLMIVSSVLFLYIFLFFNKEIVIYILSEPVLYSIYLRGEGLFSVLNELTDNFEVLMFGAGSISSIDMMTKGMEVNRSTDIVSLMLYSNGIIGSLLINIPIILYFYRLKINSFLCNRLKVVVLNKTCLVMILMFLVSGAYTFWGYVYLVLIISSFSSKYMKND